MHHWPVAAVEVEAAIMLFAAILVMINPAFEARPDARAQSASQALRDGTRALIRDRTLRNTGARLGDAVRAETVRSRSRRRARSKSWR